MMLSFFASKRLAKFFDCSLPDRVLHMQIMLCHIYISMAYDTLDRGKVNSQCLHLGNIGVSAAMGCQHPNAFYLCKRFLKLLPEVGGITRHIYYSNFPNKFRVSGTKQSSPITAIDTD